jgi:hypothetical protein
MKTIYLVSISAIGSKVIDNISRIILDKLKNNHSYGKYVSVKLENLNEIIIDNLELIEKKYKQSKEEFTEFYQKFITDHINEAKKSTFDVTIFIGGLVPRFYDIIVDYPFDHKLYASDKLFQLKNYYINNSYSKDDDYWDKVSKYTIEIKQAKQVKKYLIDIEDKFREKSYKIGNYDEMLIYFDNFFSQFITKQE